MGGWTGDVPFQSEKQRRFLWANEPEIARRWAHGEHSSKKLKGKVKFVVPIGGDAKMFAALVGKMGTAEGDDGYLLHTLIFHKDAFPKKRDVRAWMRAHAGKKGYRMGHISLGTDNEWHIRQGSPDISGMEKRRIKCDTGIEAIIGMPRPKLVVKSTMFSALPVMPPIGGASGPGDKTPAMPDWESIYYQPEAKKRMKKEAEQSLARRRSLYRDFQYSGFHGRPADDKPILRYLPDRSLVVDVAIKPVHFLTSKQIKQAHDRIRAGVASQNPVKSKNGRNRRTA